VRVLMSTPLRGVFPVLPTPVGERDEVLVDEIPGLVEWALARGAHGITVCGVTSEVFRLSDAERRDIARAACDAVDHRVPVVVGVGHLSTGLAVGTAADAVEAGASAVLAPPPPIGATSPAAIHEHYAALARAVPVSVILQDDPVHLGVGLTTAVLLELSASFGNIRHGKLEEVPSLDKIREVTGTSAGGLGCFGGSGGVYALEELMAGAIGIMTGFAYPEALVAIFDAWAEGDLARARRYNLLISALSRIEALPKITLSLRKHLYLARGAMSSAAVRRPGVTASDWTVALALRELELLDADWARRDAPIDNPDT
jgi:4-hydroxy-tetrahydrodipicolinate synthase